jgi:beta-glucanase (GH16 family)
MEKGVLTLKKNIIMCFFRYTLFTVVLFLLSCSFVQAQNKTDFIYPENLWFDNEGKIINAHGGGMLYFEGKYYWFGEHKGEKNNAALVGVTCYSSSDLYNWRNEGIALPVSENQDSPIVTGCTIERPKVIYNSNTGKFVMYFHLELKGRGYEAAHIGVAVSDEVTGPYQLIKNGRVNPGKWPLNMSEKQRQSEIKHNDFKEWWTPEWMNAIKDGLFVRRDFENGQMSRDMTLFVDDDNKVYHIYSSEDNLTLQIAELTADYLDYTGRYIRIEPGGHNEAPAIFKKDGRYFMITSGCTGWEPNAARLLVADDIMGDWVLHPNPCKGKDAELTFHSQSTYILPVQGKKNAFIFMADRWRPRNPIDGRYVWLPILFEKGIPVLKWFNEWNLNVFDELIADTSKPKQREGYKLVWSDEFNYEGTPNPEIWSFEHGFERNEEHQWYQSDNAVCEKGLLVISGQKEYRKNPNYEPGSKDWRRNREYIEYTSSSIKTEGKKEFQYGSFEIRAKIPTASGAWPAIWTLGTNMEWPSNGEIDIMEYYRIDGVPHILANTAWGTEQRFNARWNSSKIPFSHFLKKDTNWADKFHIWRMDWDEEYIRLYLDDELLNETSLSETFNGSLGEKKNPFRQPHYLLLNLAIGGINGSIPDINAFPLIYEIDYVRVYQKTP